MARVDKDVPERERERKACCLSNAYEKRCVCVSVGVRLRMAFVGEMLCM